MGDIYLDTKSRASSYLLFSGNTSEPAEAMSVGKYNSLLFQTITTKGI